MTHTVTIGLPDGQERQIDGVDEIYLVNPESHGEIFWLADKMRQETADELSIEECILFVNVAHTAFTQVQHN